MDVLKVDGQEVLLRSELLQVINELALEEGGVQAACDAVREASVSGQPNQALARVLERLRLDFGRVRELSERHRVLLGWLTRTLGDLGPQQYEWPLQRGAAGTLPLWTKPVAVSASASMVATIESDLDGEILDGAVKFDAAGEAFVRVGVSGKLEGAIEHQSLLGQFAVSAAFKSGAEVAISNYFRHRKEDTVFEVVVADLAAFRLPGRTVSADSLRARIQATSGGRVVIPDQWVHLRASGFIQIAGRLAWGTSFLRTASITDQGLGLDETVSLGAHLGASLSYSYLLAGDFDIVLSASPSGPPWLSVELTKSRTSRHQAGFEVGAKLAIEGLDRVALAVLDGFLPKVRQLAASLESSLGEWGDLRKLFEARIEGAVEELLARPRVEEQIRRWLGTIGSRLDLKNILKELASEAALRLAGDQIDSLQEHVDVATEAIKDLIRKYRRAIEKIEGAVGHASRLKLGISYARTESRLESEDVALSLEVATDSPEGVELLRRMTLGDFEPALREAGNLDARVRIRGGALTERGTLVRTSELTLNVFDVPLNHGSILTQEWESRVTLSGEVNIGVKTRLEGHHRGWTRLRTCSFLADSAVIARVGEADELFQIAEAARLALELTDEFRPTIKELDAFGRTLARLGVAPSETSMVKDLALPVGGSKPFGQLVATVLLELGKPEIDRILSTGDSRGRRIFTDALLEFYVREARFHVFDQSTERLPVMLWDSVQGERDLITGNRKPTGTLVFQDNRRSSRVLYNRDEQVLLFFYCRLIEAFSRTLRRLGGLRGSLRGLNPHQAQAAIRRAHLDLLGASADLVKGTFLEGHRLNYALFSALFKLASPDGGLDPFAVIQRKDDEKIFVYG